MAQEHVNSTLQDLDIGKIINQMWQPVVAQIQAQGKTLTAEHLQRIDTLCSDIFSKPMLTLMQEQAGIMADQKTLEEIIAMQDFYATPVGRSVMRKLPDVIAEQQSMNLELIQSRQAELMGGLRIIVSTP